MTMIYDLVTEVQLDQADRAEMMANYQLSSKPFPCPECGEIDDVVMIQIHNTKYRKCFKCRYSWQTKANARKLCNSAK